ncbi:MAG TPA: hypothetical protein VG797_06515 [Phycisphaerales bacterium]|nr:hypothetical protein [Phycisphaerales bacterium]
MSQLKLSLVAGIALGIASAANAGLYSFNLRVDWAGEAWDSDSYPDAYEVIPGSSAGEATVHGIWSQAEWGIEFWLGFDDGNGDERSGGPRLVTANLVLTNTTAAAQDFSVTTLLFLGGPKGPANQMRGFHSGSVGDNSIAQDGATLTNNLAGDPLYTALMDGASVQTLRDNPQLFTAAGGSTNTIPTTSFGSPAFIMGPAANASIGIINRFRLSPDDSTTQQSTFLINPVPTPGAISLIGLAGIAGLRRRR